MPKHWLQSPCACIALTCWKESPICSFGCNMSNVNVNLSHICVQWLCYNEWVSRRGMTDLWWQSSQRWADSEATIYWSVVQRHTPMYHGYWLCSQKWLARIRNHTCIWTTSVQKYAIIHVYEQRAYKDTQSYMYMNNERTRIRNHTCIWTTSVQGYAIIHVYEQRAYKNTQSYMYYEQRAYKNTQSYMYMNNERTRIRNHTCIWTTSVQGYAIIHVYEQRAYKDTQSYMYMNNERTRIRVLSFVSWTMSSAAASPIMFSLRTKIFRSFFHGVLRVPFLQLRDVAKLKRCPITIATVLVVSNMALCVCVMMPYTSWDHIWQATRWAW